MQSLLHAPLRVTLPEIVPNEYTVQLILGAVVAVGLGTVVAIGLGVLVGTPLVELLRSVKVTLTLEPGGRGLEDVSNSNS